jgi:lysophospholipase
VVFLGAEEKIVTVEEIHRRMGRWSSGTLELVPRAEHEVLMETPAIRARAFDRIAALFDAQR